MANRYWVASRDSDWSSSSAWASSSGGTPGASAPSIGDTVIIDGANNKNGGVHLDISINDLLAFTITNGFKGVFNFNGYSLSSILAINIGNNAILVGLANVVLTSTGANIIIGGNQSALRNLQVHSGLFNLNAITGIKVSNSYIKNVVATSAVPQCLAVNCFDQGGCSGFSFHQEVGTEVPVEIPEPENGLDFRVPLQLEPLSGARVDYWNQSQFKLTLGTSVVDFASSSKFKLLDLNVSYDGKELRFSQISTPTHAYADVALDAPVTLEMDLGHGMEVFFRGKVRKRTHSGVNHAEEIEYSCVGMQNLADEVDFIGRDGMPGDVFPGFSFTTGQIISDLFAQNATSLSSLSIISTIVDNGLQHLTTLVRENLNIEGSGFTSALRNILKEDPARKVFFDDTQGAWTFPNLLYSQPYDLSIDLAGLDSNVYTLDISNRYTAIECYAPFSSSGVASQRAFTELQPDWDIDFEADWTIRKALGMDGADQFGDSYAWVFRRWKFSANSGNSAQRYKPARMYCLVPWWREYTWVPIDSFIDWQNSVVVAKVPVVIKGNPHAAGDCIGPLASVLSFWDPKSFPVSNLAFIRVPEVGFEGSAYEKFGVAKVKRQVVDVNQLLAGYAQDRLDVLKDVIVTADIPIHGDPIREFINLGATLRVVDSNRVTGMEEFYGMVIGYKYQFGRPGLNSISITTDKSIVSKASQ